MERLDDFMARANAAYYASHDPYADFTTAPEIFQGFGEVLGLWVAVVWQTMGAPDPVILAEAGPGRGTLMDDVTLDEAVSLLAEKGKTLKPRGAAAKKAKGGQQQAAQVETQAQPTQEQQVEPAQQQESPVQQFEYPEADGEKANLW